MPTAIGMFIGQCPSAARCFLSRTHLTKCCPHVMQLRDIGEKDIGKKDKQKLVVQAAPAVPLKKRVQGGQATGHIGTGLEWPQSL